MKLYWSARTRAVRGHWMLEELGVDYEIQLIDIHDEASQADPGFRAVSPQGKVPALEDGPVKLWDSTAILMYLADKYADKGLAPALDDPNRATYAFWMSATPGMLEPAMFTASAENMPAAQQRGWGEVEQVMAQLAQTVDPGPYLCGDQFTAADIMVSSTLSFMAMFGNPPTDPRLLAYMERCASRPAAQTAINAQDEDYG